MKKDEVVVKILSNPKLFSFFQYLKTENWNKLTTKKKENFYNRLNAMISEILDIDVVDLYIDDEGINQDNFEDPSSYKNTFVDSEGTLIINDVNYNQYLTVYEYFFRLRLHLLELSFSNEYKLGLSEEDRKALEKNYKFVTHGDISLKMMLEEGHPYEDYQFINKEARKFAETIVFELVRRNYDPENCYDEEKFMSNYRILDNEVVMSMGESHYNDHCTDTVSNMHKLSLIIKKIENLKGTNLTKVKDEDLLFMVYPSIIKNSKPEIVINAFNEIIRRIYGDGLKIKRDKKEFFINNNAYSNKELPNLLNILLYECLNNLDNDLREDTSLLDENILRSKGIEEAIKDYKKKWLYSVVRTIDNANDEDMFSAFKYQSLYRLINKEVMESVINKTTKNSLPLKKRGSK